MLFIMRESLVRVSGDGILWQREFLAPTGSQDKGHCDQRKGDLDQIVEEAVPEVLTYAPADGGAVFILNPCFIDFAGEDEPGGGAPHEERTPRADGSSVGDGDPVGLYTQRAAADLDDDGHHGRSSGTGAENTGHHRGDDHDGHDQQLGVMDGGLQISGDLAEQAGLADDLGEEEEGGDGEHRFQVHLLDHPDLLHRGDDHGCTISQHGDDFGRNDFLGHKAPGGKHAGKDDAQVFQDIKPDLDVFVLAFQVGHGQLADGAIPLFSGHGGGPNADQHSRSKGKQREGVTQITKKTCDTACHYNNCGKIAHGGGSAAGVAQGKKHGEKGAHIPAVHFQGLEQDKHDGQDHHDGRDVVQAGRDQEHHGAEQDQAKALLPFGEIGDLDRQELHDPALCDQVGEQLHHNEDHKDVVGIVAHHGLYRDM